MADKTIPTSTVPIVNMDDDSIKQYKFEAIRADHLTVSEETDVDELRSISLEDSSVIYFIDELDAVRVKNANLVSDLLNAKMEISDNPSFESFSDVTNALSVIGDKVTQFFGSLQDRAHALKNAGKAIRESLADYVPGKESYKSKRAKDVHVNQAITASALRDAGNRQVRLAEFIRDRYKDMLQSSLIKVMEAIARYYRKNYLGKKATKHQLKDLVSELTDDTKNAIGNALVDLLVGVSEKRQLIGGYTLERQHDWKNKFLSTLPVFSLSGGTVFNIGNILSFDHEAYKGDGKVKPLSRSELSELLDIADKLLDASSIALSEVTFSESEFSEIFESPWAEGELSENLLIGDKWRMVKDHKNRKHDIDKQLKGVASFPLKIMSRNVAAAHALQQFVKEAIQHTEESES